jgi:translation initiation factor IF-3
MCATPAGRHRLRNHQPEETTVSTPHRPRTNTDIDNATVRIVDDTGRTEVTETSEALERAQAAGLDLVETTRGVDPPVCVIADAGQWAYQQARSKRIAGRGRRTKTVKDIKVGVTTSDNDLARKRRDIQHHLDSGHPVRVTVTLKGRLRSRPELAAAKLAQLLDGLTGTRTDTPVRTTGAAVSTTVTGTPGTTPTR